MLLLKYDVDVSNTIDFSMPHMDPKLYKHSNQDCQGQVCFFHPRTHRTRVGVLGEHDTLYISQSDVQYFGQRRLPPQDAFSSDAENTGTASPSLGYRLRRKRRY